MEQIDKKVEEFVSKIEARNPGEPEFLQAVREVAITVIPFIEKNEKYKGKKILERLAEPERTIMFKVEWVDDKGEIQVNRGYRIQTSSLIGPYKGGTRFAPNVNLSVLKFLGFEQVLKNGLTTLPMGGAKGGSDFDPNGKSEMEVMRFCQAYMNELYRHIGPNTDVPAGDLGVGAREIGFMFGQYRKLKNEFTGVFTGKGVSYGGSLIRPESTGFGATYFCEQLLATKGHKIQGKVVAISGFGNVAWGVAKKMTELGAKVVTISGPDGYVYIKDGLTPEQVEYLKVIRASGNNKVEDFVKKYPEAEFHKGKKPWGVKCDIAMPCATQNELDLDDAKALIKNGVTCVTEVANMPSSIDAINYFLEHKILFAPGKAANAGGVATSGLEMTQNSTRLSWTAEEVDKKLREIMSRIHNVCVEYGTEPDGYVNYVKGANIAGFVKVADAMIAQGVV